MISKKDTGLSRRDFLRLVGYTSGSLLAACTPLGSLAENQTRSNLAKDIRATATAVGEPGRQELFKLIPADILAATYLLRGVNDRGEQAGSGTGLVVDIIEDKVMVLTANHALPEFNQSVLIADSNTAEFPLTGGRSIKFSQDLALGAFLLTTNGNLPRRLSGLSVFSPLPAADFTAFDRLRALGFPNEPGGSTELVVGHNLFVTELTNFRQGNEYVEADGLVGPAMSGGPVINEQGLVVGLVQGFEPHPRNLLQGQLVTGKIDPLPPDFFDLYREFAGQV